MKIQQKPQFSRRLKKEEVHAELGFLFMALILLGSNNESLSDLCKSKPIEKIRIECYGNFI